MIKALRNASGNASLPGETVFAYLHSIATSAGNDTAEAYKILKQRNDEFVAYIKSNSSELSYWKKSQSFADRNPLNGFLNLHQDLVYALRQVGGLAWGAIDFGPRASGDIMHFDLRTIGVGKMLCEKIGGYVPKAGHPSITKEIATDEVESEQLSDDEFTEEAHFHEEIESAENEDYGNYEEETRSYPQVSSRVANAYLTLTGEKQGQIKGGVTQKGREGTIAVYQLHHEITSPRDAASGQARGKRIHKPLVITKEIDTASVKLFQALVTNESLKKVVINFYQPAAIGAKGGGLEINSYRITLTDAVITNISQNLPNIFNPAEMKFPFLEKVEFVYQKITWEYLANSPGMASDDMKGLGELEFHEAVEEAEGYDNS